MRGGPYRFLGAGITAVMVLALFLPGCSDPKYADLKAFVQEHDHDVVASNYRIEPPDMVSVRSPTAPEIDGETQEVRSDGKISLRLLGEVKVSGLTPQELATKLEELLARYYVDPKVNVRIMAYRSKNIYVFGEVSRRGALPFTGHNSLLKVLGDAQPTFLAWGAQVKVIRPSAAPDERRELTVDIDKMIQTGDMRANVLLQEGDIVYVPPTPLAWLGLRVREVLFPFTPMATAYEQPAGLMWTTDYYTGEYDDDDYRGRRRYR